MEEVLVSEEVTIIIGMCMMMCVVLPIAALVIFRIRTKVSIKPAVYGLILYISFSLGVEQLLNIVFLGINTPVASFLTSYALPYAIYGALIAALCEGFARFFGLKLLKNDYPDKKTAITYGIGHGGMECIVIGAFSLFMSLTYAVALNSMGYEGFITSGGDENVAAMITLADSIMYDGSAVYYAAIYERVLTMALQIALSILTFAAVLHPDDKRMKTLFPCAMGIHFAIDFVAALYQVGVITNLFLEEGIITVMAAGAVYLSVRVYKNIKSSAI